MIGPVHDALKAMLHRDAKLPQSEVDIRFATPTREWTASLNRPTINFYLYDLVENTKLRAHDMEVRRGDASAARRLRPRRVDLKYVVNVFFKSQSGEMDDQEWLVLWRVLATLMRNAEWPERDVPAGARDMQLGILGAVSQPGENARLSEIWSGIGNTARTGLHYVLTVPLDLNVEFLSPLVLEQQTRVVRSDEGEVVSQRRRYGWRLRGPDNVPLIGAEVRLADGSEIAFSDENGAFFLRVGAEEMRHMRVKPDGGQDWAEVITVPGDPTVLVH